MHHAFQMVALLGALSASGACTSKYTAGDHNVTITVGTQDEKRVFSLHVPWQACGYSCTGAPSTPSPLVLNWHGCNGHYPLIDYQKEVTRIDSAASDYGWHVITPLGSQSPISGQWGWNTNMGIDGVECAAAGQDEYAFAQVRNHVTP
jgi:poly(3-hydroxybutyrate) depolymerase